MDGIFLGTVIDSLSKRPLVNATVTATSPALAEPQVAFTDDSGNYRIPKLPPGSYELSFTMIGYRGFAHTGVPLHLSQTERINAELVPVPIG
jgi:hypothetical protein